MQGLFSVDKSSKMFVTPLFTDRADWGERMFWKQIIQDTKCCKPELIILQQGLIRSSRFLLIKRQLTSQEDCVSMLV